MTIIHTNSFVEEQKGVEWLLLLIQAGKWSFSFSKSASNKSLHCGPFFLSVDLSKSFDHGTLLKEQSFCFLLWEEWKQLLNALTMFMCKMLIMKYGFGLVDPKLHSSFICFLSKPVTYFVYHYYCRNKPKLCLERRQVVVISFGG